MHNCSNLMQCFPAFWQRTRIQLYKGMRYLLVSEVLSVFECLAEIPLSFVTLLLDQQKLNRGIKESWTS